MSQLIPCVIEGEFAWQIAYSYAGGVNELEIGGACTSAETAIALEAKIVNAMAIRKGVNIRLELTETECFCLASASQNCEFNGLPKRQRDWLNEWHERWKRSVYAQPSKEATAS